MLTDHTDLKIKILRKFKPEKKSYGAAPQCAELFLFHLLHTEKVRFKIDLF